MPTLTMLYVLVCKEVCVRCRVECVERGERGRMLERMYACGWKAERALHTGILSSCNPALRVLLKFLRSPFDAVSSMGFSVSPPSELLASRNRRECCTDELGARAAITKAKQDELPWAAAVSYQVLNNALIGRTKWLKERLWHHTAAACVTDM